MNRLKLALPKAWSQQSTWLVLLLPLSLLYALAMLIRQYVYKLGLKSIYRAPIPVMIVGNITVGGSGKTPMIIALIQYLRDHLGLNIAVISRGYGGTGSFPRIVLSTDTPDMVGDEPVLIVRRTGVLMAVGANRQQSIELLLADAANKQTELDLILSDDGLQHLALARDIEWVVLDANRGLSNGWLLPAGPLRELPAVLKTMSVIEHGKPTSDQTDTHNPSKYRMHLEPAEFWALQDTQLVACPKIGDTVYAVAGIGDPSRFFATLTQLGLNVIEKPFADHYAYTADDFATMTDFTIVTTEKDAVKMTGLGVVGWVLAVDAVLSKNCYTLLYAQLETLGVLQNSTTRNTSSN